MKIRKDDKVVVLSGRDKGKEGKVLSADPKNGKVIVEGVLVASRHQKPRHPRGSHRCRRRKGARLQEVRRRYLREESDRILWLTLQD